MTGAFAHAAVATALGVASVAHGAAVQRRAGTVLYSVGNRLYLDAGTRDGLSSGQVLPLRRGQTAVGTCTVLETSDTKATCRGQGRPGDAFALSPRPPPEPRPHRPFPEPPSAAVAEQRRSALATAPFEKVDFHEVPGMAAPRGAEARIVHTTWASTGSMPWQQERADVALRGYALGAGLSLDLDLSARRWSRRSDPVSFRPQDPSQLYVWEAALSRRSMGGGLAFSLGRVRPRGLAGQVLLDGAQMGFRSGAGEAGVFGGVVPDGVTLSPSLEHGTLGAYWSSRRSGPADSLFLFMRHEARVAFVNTAELGRRLEGEVLLDYRITRRFDAAVDARFGVGDFGAPGGLDAIRIDGGARPFDSFSLNGSFRYEGLSVPELDGPGRIFRGGAARHAQFSAAWEPSSAVRISLLSGLATDLTTPAARRWLGSELAFPDLLATRLMASAGYFQEGGWTRGHTGWIQVILRSHLAFRILTRVSWFRSTGIAPRDLDELGASAALEAQLGPFVSLRLTALGRTALNGDTRLFGRNSGQTGILDAGLTGQF